MEDDLRHQRDRRVEEQRPGKGDVDLPGEDRAQVEEDDRPGEKGGQDGAAERPPEALALPQDPEPTPRDEGVEGHPSHRGHQGRRHDGAQAP